MFQAVAGGGEGNNRQENEYSSNNRQDNEYSGNNRPAGDGHSAAHASKPSNFAHSASTTSFMGALNESLGGKRPEPQPEPKKPAGLMDKLHGAMGGGRKAEEQEDMLDKSTAPPRPPPHASLTAPPAIDYVQEKFLGAGPQDNESALEQAKDKQIANSKPPPLRARPPLTARSDPRRIQVGHGQGVSRQQQEVAGAAPRVVCGPGGGGGF